MNALAKPSTLLAGSDTARSLAMANEKIRKFGEHIQQQTAAIVAPINAALGVLKATPYYLLHLVREGKKKALAWLTDRLDLLEAELSKAFTSKAKTAFRLSEKIESLSKTFPTSSSVNP